MKPRSERIVFILFVVLMDCLIIFDAFSVAYLLRFQFQFSTFYWPPEPPAEYLKAMVVVAYSWLILFRVCGLYDFSKSRSDLDTVQMIVKTISLGTILILSMSYFYRDFSFSRLVCVYAWAFSVVLFSCFRLALNRLRASIFREGIGVRNVLLVGSRRLASYLARRLGGSPEFGYRIIGALDDGEASSDLPCEVLGGVGDLERILAEESIDRVFIVHPALGHLEQHQVISICDRLSVPLSMVPPTYDLLINHRDFEEVDGIPIVSVRERDARWLYETTKRGMDIVLASLLLTLLSPLAALIAILIKRQDGGPAIFSQLRVGRDGKTFRIYKFRTMVTSAEKMLAELVDLDQLSEPVFKLNDDPRVTKLGRLLRRTSLDELPQLVNVLRGEMSLVGPRPEEASVVERYSIWERRRLKAIPGITGLQQVECRGSTSLKERVGHDIIYLRKRSLFLDVWILLQTVYVVIAGRGAR